MNKTEIKKELRGDSGFWNSVKIVAGIPVARVCWDKNQYKVLRDKDTTFEEVIDTEEVKDTESIFDITRNVRTYKPLKEFYYQKELLNYIYDNQ